MTPKHIKVELDFIPVESGLPDDCKEFVCLIASEHCLADGYHLIDELYFDGVEWIKEDKPLAKPWFVTHYTELPRAIGA